jgi:hypothetical protein
MSVYPCTFCKQRKPGKLANAYWAWFKMDGERSAWRVRLCLGCAPGHLAILLSSSELTPENSNVFACVSCGADASEDSAPMYCTLYLPKKEPMEYALQLCGACAVRLQATISTSAERLPDRGGVVRGPSPDASAWDAIGLAST